MSKLSKVSRDYFSEVNTSWLLSKSLRYSHIFVPASELRIRGIEFRSSRDLADLQDDARKHLTSLCEMFFLQDGAAHCRDDLCLPGITGGHGKRQVWLRFD